MYFAKWLRGNESVVSDNYGEGSLHWRACI